MNRRIERRRGERTRRSASRVGAIVVGAVLAGGVLTVGAGATGSRTGPAASGDPAASCTLGDGVQHVVEITLDDAHFFRDNPNVPSDLELMPNLKNFIEQNGTLLSNSHTPLIANSASDALTTLTGLYGDRHGMPISNGYRSFNPDGTTARPPRLPTGPIRSWTQQARRRRATTPTRRWSIPRRRPPRRLLRRRQIPRRPRRGCRSPGPGATWARSERPTSTSRAHETSRMRSGRARPRRSSSARTRTRSRTRKSLTTLVSRFIAPPVARCARRPKP